MSMMEAAKSVFSQYVGFSGRARRAEYWKFVLFNFIVTAVISVIGGILQAATGSQTIATILDSIWSLAILLPSLAVSIRRLHDIGKSGWWLLISLVPLVGSIILLVFECKDSQPGENQYGPNPKGM